jgi:hypothetical protein
MQLNGRSLLRRMLASLLFHPREDFMTTPRRTTHRSTAGKKLYAVRDSKGRFKDIQTYERAHAADLKRKAKDEKPVS